jgi:hypothetical protein
MAEVPRLYLLKEFADGINVRAELWMHGLAVTSDTVGNEL